MSGDHTRGFAGYSLNDCGCGLHNLQPQLRFYFVYTHLFLALESGFDHNDCPSYWRNL